jgi:hypothetical protein
VAGSSRPAAPRSSLNDAVNADVKEADPMETAMRIATMLFEK